MDLVVSVKNSIICNGLVSAGDKIIIGVSGGPDSVALLYAMNRLKYELGIQLHIAHYNHCMRKSSDADQRFVEALSNRLNISCTIGIWKGYNDNLRYGSLEESARKARFDFFIQVALKQNAAAVALAHNADDQAETILMRILRGTGALGIRGMLQDRKINNVRFIRPMLQVSRCDIERYLKDNNISFRIDPTNKQLKFFRNKIRHKLLPLIEAEYNSGVKGVLSNLADVAAADYDYIEQQAEKAFLKIVQCKKKGVYIDLKRFMRKHVALRRMILRMAIEYVKGDIRRIELRHMKEIENMIRNRPVDSVVNLPAGISVVKVSKDIVTIRQN